MQTSNAPAVRVLGLGKQYALGEARRAGGTFYDALSGLLKTPFRRGSATSTQAAESSFWALNDVSFDVQPGEVVGIIGRNGAGKSTLLKVLSRITAPTTGRVEVRGRLASLLEVGTGFHPELSGRENIFLNGAILGMPRREIERKFDEIVAFAEVEKFIDTPVKRYSSGMYVRLAFAVAAHLDTDILVVDEVLAVGDSQFQRKCLGKMGDVSRSGRTVLFVSHSLSAMSQLCSRGLVLQSGSKVFDGPISDAIMHYTTQLSSSRFDASAQFGSLSDGIKFERVIVNDLQGAGEFVLQPSVPLRVQLDWRVKRSTDHLVLQMEVKRDGHRIVSQRDVLAPQAVEAGTYRSQFELPELFLSPGEYFLEFGAFDTDRGDWTWSRQQIRTVIADEWHPGYDPRSNMGLVNVQHAGRRESVAASENAQA